MRSKPTTLCSVFLVLGCLLSAGNSAFGKTVPEVQKFLVQELNHLQSAPPMESSTVSPGQVESLSEYQLSLFRLRIKAEFGFDAGVGKITLEPVAEFFWE